MSVSNTPLPDTLKPLLWSMVFCGMGVSGATPEPNQFFCYGPFQTQPSQVFKTTFSDPWSAGVWVFGASPQNPNSRFWPSPFQTHLSRVFKNTFSDPWSAGIWVFASPPQNPNSSCWQCPFQTHLSLIFQNPCYGPWCSVVWVFGAPPQNPNNFSLCPISNTPIPGIQKHIFRPMICRGMGVSGATPEPKQ